MRLLQANKILLASCVVVVPCKSCSKMPLTSTASLAEFSHSSVSFYGGLALKEYFLEKELPKVERDEIKYRADRARIAQ